MVYFLGKNLTYVQVIAQIIGIIGVLEFSFVPHQKTKKRVLIWQIIGTALYGLQYVLLTAWSAALICLLNIVRDLVFFQFEKKEKETPKIYLVAFLLIATCLSFVTYNGILSLIPLFVTYCTAWSTWQKNLKRYRLMAIVTNIVWIIYNYSSMAYVSFIGNVIHLISAIISVIRLNFIDEKKNG